MGGGEVGKVGNGVKAEGATERFKGRNGELATRRIGEKILKQ